MPLICIIFFHSQYNLEMTTNKMLIIAFIFVFMHFSLRMESGMLLFKIFIEPEAQPSASHLIQGAAKG